VSAQTQSTSVRGHTSKEGHTSDVSKFITNSSIRDASISGKSNSSWHAHNAPLLPVERSTLDPTQHIPYGRVHCSIQSDLCRPDPIVPRELEGAKSGPMDYSDCVRGLPHSLHINTPSEDLSTLKEEVQSLLQKQAISQIPNQSAGFYSNMFIVPKKDGG